MASPDSRKEEAHVVRFEIPPMMRYCAGTCPCTWGTAIILPNIVYFRNIARNQDKTESDARGNSILTGASRQQEGEYLEYLIPAQTLMGLSSYFAWYYGYGFYGPAKYPLLLYGLTLASHSVANEGDIPRDPNMILAQRAACAVGTFLCTCCFVRISKIASLTMLPACGVYIGLTYVTYLGLNGNNTSNNANSEDASQGNSEDEETQENSNSNANQDPPSRFCQAIQNATVATTPPSRRAQFPHHHHGMPYQRKRRKRQKSILKPDDDTEGRSIAPDVQREGRHSKTNVSFNDTIGIQYHPRQFSSSPSSSSLSSHEDIVKL